MKNSQLGRSMIEMLAVLAIIGILSLGGISGYNIVITNNKANAILDTVSKIAAIARTTGMTTTNEKAIIPLPDGVYFISAEPNGTITIKAPGISDAVFQKIKNALQSHMHPNQIKASFTINFSLKE